MARREPDGDTGVEVAIDRIRKQERELEDLKAFVAGKLPHTHPADGVSGRGARASLGSAQSIANSTWTQVNIDTANDDPDGLFDSANNEMDADKAGWWLVSTAVGFAGDSGGDRRFCAFAVNGTRQRRGSVSPASGGNMIAVVVDVVKIASGDRVEVQAWQNSGGSLSLQAASEQTWLSVAYLGSA